MSRFFKAEIVSNLPLSNKYNLLTIKPLNQSENPQPGQFYMIKVSNSIDPLLLRPFSFFRKSAEGIQFLFEIRGKGTLIMRRFKNGDVIHLLGPLGKGYPDIKDNKIPVLIAGGIGIASIYSLAEKFGKKSILFYGALNRESLLMLDELKSLVNELIITTDDGSVGKRGTVIDAFNDFITYNSSLITRCQIYACGRKQMLEVLSGAVRKSGIRGYISVEENMACGVGACLGCAVKAKSKELRAKSMNTKNINSELRTPNSELIYKMVCKDGPVFSIEEIVWE